MAAAGCSAGGDGRPRAVFKIPMPHRICERSVDGGTFAVGTSLIRADTCERRPVEGANSFAGLELSRPGIFADGLRHQSTAPRREAVAQIVNALSCGQARATALRTIGLAAEAAESRLQSDH